MPVLKEKSILWIIVNANNEPFALSLVNSFLHKRSSLLHKGIEFHECISVVCETVALPNLMGSLCETEACSRTLCYKLHQLRLKLHKGL